MKHREIHERLVESAAGLPPGVAALLQVNGALRLRDRRRGPFYDYLCATVVAQQLSARAADAIWARVQALPAARQMSLAEFARSTDWEQLRGCGLSRNKARAMHELSLAYGSGELDERQLSRLPTADLTRQISALWGFGAWSAEMVAIFYFGHEDVWSEGDVSLQRGLARLTGGRRRDAQRILRAMQPYRSYFARHLWRGLDQGVL